LGGWVLVFSSTVLINRFELFGLHQVTSNPAGRHTPAPTFRTPLLYNFVRHPIYLGFIIAFWAAPTMSAGHLLFAAVTTAYLLVGIMLAERDLVDVFGRRIPELQGASIDAVPVAQVNLNHPQIVCKET
jgi:methanethiol S-methyltransferase